MTRSELLAYLADTFRKITTELNLDQADTTTGYKYPLDQTMRKLGLATAGPVPDVSIEQAQALGEYYSLRRFYTHVATRVDAPLEGAMPSRSQIFRQIGDLLKLAEERCAALGVSVSGSNDLSGFSILTDWIEPEVTNA